jgi:hypothetical protein
MVSSIRITYRGIVSWHVSKGITGAEANLTSLALFRLNAAHFNVEACLTYPIKLRPDASLESL